MVYLIYILLIVFIYLNVNLFTISYPRPAGRRPQTADRRPQTADRINIRRARADRLRAPVHDLRIASFVILRAGRVRDLAGSSYARAEEVERLPLGKIV